MKAHVLGFAVAVAVLTSAEIGAATPEVTRSHAGDLTGQVVKVGSGQITVKYPVVVQTGVTHHTVGSGAHRRSVAVPRYGTKQIEATNPITDAVTVRTAGRKSADLTDVRIGLQVQLRVEKVVERVPGEKPVSHYEVSRILIPSPPK